MDGDNKLSQGKIVKVLNPKAVLLFFVIEYDLNYLSNLEAEIFWKEFASSNSVRKLLNKASVRADEEGFSFS